MNTTFTLTELVNLIKEGGDWAVAHQNSVQVIELKDGRSPVTTADDHLNTFLKAGLSRLDQAALIISEEDGDHQDKKYVSRWVLDPLDGTTNYLRGMPFYAISVAYESPEGHMAVIYLPGLKELWATDGKQLFLNGNVAPYLPKLGSQAVIGVPFGMARLQQGALDAMFGIHVMRRFGCCALEFAFLAAGRLDGLLTHTLPLWDELPGQLLCKAAGILKEQEKLVSGAAIVAYRRPEIVK